MTQDAASRERLILAIGAIDEANAADPNTIVFDGAEHPKELLHADLMTNWVGRLRSTPSDAQLLAARAHHLRRWELPRTSYPEGRAGYLRWRADQKKKHASEVGEILAAVGYDDETIDRVKRIIRKESIRSDPEVQVHEDALCLVFLQTQLDDLAADLGDDRMKDVVVKTWEKMSTDARGVALELELSPGGRRLVEEALAS